MMAEKGACRGLACELVMMAEKGACRGARLQAGKKEENNNDNE